MRHWSVYRKPKSFFCGLMFCLLVSSANSASTSEAGVTDDLMTEAIRVLDIVTGQKTTPKNDAWLRDFWVEQAGDHPERIIAWLEEIVTADRVARSGIDPLALVQLRAEIINEAYCAPTRSSEAWKHRVRTFLAPPELVLAADCLTWAVVTPFDVAALARSNAMVGDILGHPVDAKASEELLRQIVANDFDDLHVDIQQRLLWGELRAGALELVWSSVNEATREEFTEAAKVSFDSHGDVATTAFEMEKTALKRLSELAAIAKSGNYWLSPQELSINFEFIEFVAETGLSPRDRAEIADMLVTHFEADPKKVTEVAQNLRHWLDKGYHFGNDPETGRIRSWSADEQRAMREKEAAHLYCFNDRSDDPSGKPFNEIVFADDPVIEADCANKRITRESDRLLAENDKVRLTRHVADAHRRAFEVIFALQFSADQRRWFEEASVADVEKGSAELTQAVDEFQQIVSKIQEGTHIGPHLNEQRREDYAIRIYCTNKDADDPDVARLIEIIDEHDPIVFEDCDRTLIVRRSDVDGLASSLNFVASLGGDEPLSEDEIAGLPGIIQPYFETRTDGPFGYVSTFRKLTYWWSRMPFEVRHRTAAIVKNGTKTREDIDTFVGTLAAQANTQLASQALCDYQIRQLGYQSQLAHFQARAIFTDNPYAGSPWVNPEAIDDAVELYGIMAPFVREQCDKVWN